MTRFWLGVVRESFADSTSVRNRVLLGELDHPQYAAICKYICARLLDPTEESR